MQNTIVFIQAHQKELVLLALLLISEGMAMSDKFKSNGIVQLAFNSLKKQQAAQELADSIKKPE